MNHKKQLEDTEILKFHSKRWEDIAGSHFMLRDSYEFRIAEAQRLADIVKPDHLFTFYNLTGISYQVVDFIHELIKLKFNSHKESKSDIVHDINRKIGGQCVGIIGNIAIIFRQNSDPEDQIYKLS